MTWLRWLLALSGGVYCLFGGPTGARSAAAPRTILFGAAYYDEYSPYDRLDADVRMMTHAGLNVVRIGESTWGTMEPQEGVFDFRHIDRVLDAMGKAGIKVIVGTPTYAIPTWLARAHPDVLVVTPAGQGKFGPRQNMDITNPNFRRAAEAMIRALIAHVRSHPAVIGYQVDNETKPYDVSGPGVQAGFVAHVRERFKNLDALNDAWGLNYWSNRINRWEDFPSTDGTVNASVSAAFAAFQRSLVTDYLAWQAGIVRELARPDQFITQNFDLDWRGYSYGIQHQVDHFAAARALDIAGIDIYHPTQDRLTGAEIALGGDLARSMKGGRNYLVIETQAQGNPDWTPYPGQLRLQAYSHLASGANMVAYWHWATTTNSAETYWRGLLSQDYAPNPTYEEAVRIGNELGRIGPDLVDLRKTNKVAVYFSNNALTAFNAFRFGWGTRQDYNDVLRPFYDALYRMNVEVDLVDPSVAGPLPVQDARGAGALRGVRGGDRPAERVRAERRLRRVHLQERLLRRERQGPNDSPAWRPGRGGGRDVQPVHHPGQGGPRRRSVRRRPGAEPGEMVDGVPDPDHRHRSREVRPSRLGTVRGDHAQPVREGRGDVRGRHAQRRHHLEGARTGGRARRRAARARDPLSAHRPQRRERQGLPAALLPELLRHRAPGDVPVCRRTRPAVGLGCCSIRRHRAVPWGVAIVEERSCQTH